MTGRGRLIAFEGIDGCGKTTQSRLLAEKVGALFTCEPGSTALGIALRTLLLDKGPEVSDSAEALLMAADRAQHVTEVVEPVLASGRHVVTDRFSSSTLAYQGYGRGLELDTLRALNDVATGGLQPDLNVLVDVSTDVARRRLDPHRFDRFETLGAYFFDKVRAGYLEMAHLDPKSWLVVDGDRPIDAISGDVVDEVCSRLSIASTRP